MAVRNPKVTTSTERTNVEGDTDAVDVPVDQLAAPDAPTQENPGHPVVEGEFVAVKDVVSWRVPIEGTVPPRHRVVRAFLGQTLPADRLPAEARERLLEQGAIASRGRDASEALTAKAQGGLPTVSPGEVGDNTLAGWDQPNLIAYVTQFPTEAERVNIIERSRVGGPRAAVVRAAGYDPETGDRLE